MDLTNKPFLHLADRLYGFKPPVYENVEYYLSVYEQYYKYKTLRADLELLWDLFSTSEDVENIRHRNMGKVVEYITGLEFHNLPPLNIKFPTKNAQYEHGKMYVSIDLKSANWNTIVKYNPIPVKSWADTLTDLGIHQGLINSKLFRQLVLGQNVCNPKKQIEYMQQTMMSLHDVLVAKSFEIIGLNKDEIVVPYEEDRYDLLRYLVDQRVFNITHFEYSFRQDRDLKSHVMTVYENGDNYDNGNVLYERLYAYNGKFFLPLLKTFILKQPLQYEDSLYYLKEDGLEVPIQYKSANFKHL